MRPTIGTIFFYPLLFIRSHPCSRAFPFSWVEIGIKNCQITAIFIKYFKRDYIWIKYRDFPVFFECYSIKPCSQSKNTLNDFLYLKVRAKDFFIDVRDGRIDDEMIIEEKKLENILSDIKKLIDEIRRKRD